MKIRKIRLIHYVLALSICVAFLLCSCGNQAKIIGTWTGDGSLTVFQKGVPFQSVEQLTFFEDGTGRAVGNSGYTDFTYALTDDTLSLRFEEIGWGIGYTIEGDTLTLRDSVFTRLP